MNLSQIVKVALPAPVAEPFDYLADSPPPPGCRVRVPFGRGERIGLVLDTAPASKVAPERLKPLAAVLDSRPCLPPDLLALCRWLVEYYHARWSEVLQAVLPEHLRRGREAPQPPPRWRPKPGAQAPDPGRAPRQAAVFAALAAAPEGLDGAELARRVPGSGRALAALRDKGLVEAVAAAAAPAPSETRPAPELTAAQRAALDALRAEPGFAAWLLEGVTGSGKTEVYLARIADVLAAGRQALLLVPEIGLTPQTLARLRERLGRPVAAWHSNLAAGERAQLWHAAAEGRVEVIVGTRSAVLLPLARPGLIVVDEEHDASFKQQEGLRYSARDVAVWRARQLGVPVLLGSATPSLESLHNVERGRYRRLHLPTRARGSAPRLHLIDGRGTPPGRPFGPALERALDETLARGEQALLFLNRRGWAPLWRCLDCGWTAACTRCTAHLTLHRSDGRLRCHHCGHSRPVPPRCPECAGTRLHALGMGTQQLETALAERFPGVPIERIDRDSTRRRGSLEDRLARVRSGAARLLVGTQMLAKGHDFPALTLVGLLGIDGALFSADFRGPEQMAQLLVQVAGRAGRGERPGRVLIETRHPDHPLLRRLVEQGYPAFARELLAERAAAGLPPCRPMAVLRAEAVVADAPLAFLDAVAAAVPPTAGVERLGPVPAPMEKRAGRFRAQLLLLGTGRGPLHAALEALRRAAEARPERRRVRWSLDVDPIDLL